jgi:hypothetical protein
MITGQFVLFILTLTAYQCTELANWPRRFEEGRCNHPDRLEATSEARLTNVQAAFLITWGSIISNWHLRFQLLPKQALRAW